MNKYFHHIAMWVIFLGGLAFLLFAFMWFVKGNLLMSFSMLIMGIMAESNFYLHRLMMKGKIKHER